MKNLSNKLGHWIVDENKRIEVARVANISESNRLIVYSESLIRRQWFVSNIEWWLLLLTSGDGHLDLLFFLCERWIHRNSLVLSLLPFLLKLSLICKLLLSGLDMCWLLSCVSLRLSLALLLILLLLWLRARLALILRIRVHQQHESPSYIFASPKSFRSSILFESHL